ncbi:MAG: hypothetical protein ACRC57_11690 [Sarcina sp.]
MKKIFFKFIFVLELCISILLLLFSIIVTFSDYIYPLPPNPTFWAKYYIPLVYFLFSLFFIYDIFNKISIKYNLKIYYKYNFQVIKFKTQKGLVQISLYYILGICSILLSMFTALNLAGFIVLLSMFIDLYRNINLAKKITNS